LVNSFCIADHKSETVLWNRATLHLGRLCALVR
jgi:hypothetical protein